MGKRVLKICYIKIQLYKKIKYLKRNLNLIYLILKYEKLYNTKDKSIH